MKTTPFVHLIKTPLASYCYDVNTNTVVKLSAENALILEKKLAGEEIGQEEDAKLGYLVEQGYLSTKRPKVMRHSQDRFLEFHLNENIMQVTLQLTQQCNFRCAYCTYAPQDFELQRTHTPKRMSEETGRAIIDFFVAHSTNQKRVILAFYGGEPLLEFELMQRLVQYAEEAFEGKKLAYTVTTNGSLLTPEVAGFLSEKGFDVTISLDGPPAIHDRSRRFAATGQGTFKTVEQNLRMIQDKHPLLFARIALNIVVDPRYGNEDLFTYFDTDPLFKDMHLRSTLIDDFFSVEHVTVSDEYHENLQKNRFLTYMKMLGRGGPHPSSVVTDSDIDGRIARLELTLKPSKELPDEMSHGGPCIPGQRRLFADVDGLFFPCERVSETSDAMQIGSVWEGFDIEKARAILNICTLTEEECKDCWALNHCNLCARFCDNNGKLCGELKKTKCAGIRQDIESQLREYLLLRELAAGSVKGVVE